MIIPPGKLERKLEGKGYQRDEIMTAVARLREWNYLDDETYLRRQIDKYLVAKKSRSYIRQRLRLAGLDPQLVEDGLDLYYPADKEREYVQFWWQKCFGDRNLHPMKRGRSFGGPVACMLLVFPSRKFGLTWTIIRSLDSFFQKRYN